MTAEPQEPIDNQSHRKARESEYRCRLFGVLIYRTLKIKKEMRLYKVTSKDEVTQGLKMK